VHTKTGPLVAAGKFEKVHFYFSGDQNIPFTIQQQGIGYENTNYFRIYVLLLITYLSFGLFNLSVVCYRA